MLYTILIYLYEIYSLAVSCYIGDFVNVSMEVASSPQVIEISSTLSSEDLAIVSNLSEQDLSNLSSQELMHLKNVSDPRLINMARMAGTVLSASETPIAEVPTMEYKWVEDSDMWMEKVKSKAFFVEDGVQMWDAYSDMEPPVALDDQGKVESTVSYESGSDRAYHGSYESGSDRAYHGSYESGSDRVSGGSSGSDDSHQKSSEWSWDKEVELSWEG